MRPIHICLQALGCLTLAVAAPAFQSPNEEPPLLPEEALRHGETIERANGLIQGGRAADAVALLRPIAEQELRELGPQSPFTVKAWNNLAYALCAAGQLAEARQTADRALELAQAQGEPSVSTAIVKRSLSEIALAMGDSQEAQYWIEETCRDMEATYGRTPMLAETRELAARIALGLGQLDRAQEHLERALAIHERFLGLSSETTAGPLAPLAHIQAQRGQLRTAVLLHETERAVLESSGAKGSPGWCRSLESEIALLAELGESERALALARAWIAASVDEEGEAAERYESRLGAGMLLLDLGAAREAVTELGQALALALQLGEASAGATLRCLQPLARADLAAGEPQQALELLERHGLSERDELDPLYLAELEHLRGSALLALGRAAEARPILIAAAKELRQATDPRSPLQRELLMRLLACEDASQGASVEMVDLVELIEAPLASSSPNALAHWARQAWASGSSSFQAPLAQGWMRLAEHGPERLDEAAAALERLRAREQIAALAWRLESAEALALPSLRERFALAHAAEALARSDDGSLPPAPAAALPDSPYADLFQDQAGALARARAWLGEPEHALVQYLWTDGDVWAWIVRTRPEQDALVHLGGARTLAARIEAIQPELRALDRTPDLRPLAEALLDPLLDHLVGTTHLSLLADGPLAFVPYEALPLADGALLLETRAIDYLTSLAALRGEPVPSGDGAVHLGPIVEHESISLSQEVQALRGRFGAAFDEPERLDSARVYPEGERVLASESARESSVRDQSASGAWQGLRLLELGVPAFVDTLVPSASGLVLTPEATDDGLAGWRRPNGFLDLGEIGSLELGAELVLLPRTRVGAGTSLRALRPQALHALVASFQRAGAGTVALTSFTTADVRARNFDESLVQAAASGPTASALARAQRAWVEHARASGDAGLLHPGIWARWRAYVR